MSAPAVVQTPRSVTPEGVVPMPQKPTIERTCLHCECQFFVVAAAIKRGGGMFCSRSCSAAGHRTDPTERFWSKVDQSGECWVWTGYCNVHGYGSFDRDGAKILAHRFSWEVHNGPIPHDMRVLHECDNPACVRPDHLFIGTQRDNVHDMIAKGRRGIITPPVHTPKTHCKRGHPYDDENTYVDPLGRRHCRKCRPIYYQNYKPKRQQRSTST